MSSPSTSANLMNEIKKTKWMTGEELIDQLEPADLVEFSRTIALAGRKRRVYAHWGIYIGRLHDEEHYVVHISTSDGDFDVRPGQDSIGQIGTKIADGSSATVRSDKFLEVAGTDQCRINNLMDRQVKPLPAVIAVERALHRLGTGDYHLIDYNCEHFVKLCRYGLRESSQANTAIFAVVSATSLTAATLGNAPAALAFSLGYAAYSAIRRFIR
ncbi:unnamed protein product, partial [Mesorhabditis belari]|uniref:LRAT domain-containing protein n=1 Tax=Mesorhabditis belari TaxID=2138241 RepID=A0AAF3FFX3_9BILA